MRSFEPRIFKAGLVAAIVTVVVPGQLMAAACNAFMNGSTSGEDEYILNDPIGITLELGAGLVEDDLGAPGVLDISYFEYQLDCKPGDTYPDCTPGGNTVEFSGNVQTTCTDENSQPITFATSVVDDVVTFTPADPATVIRNSSEDTCEVTFDVTVIELSESNATQEVVELTGWANVDESVGVCKFGPDPDNPTSTLLAAAASSVAIPFTSSTQFTVTKDFSDDSTMPVDVHIRCNGGLPLEQSFTITESTFVNFTVVHFIPGELDCTVWEDPVPDGYTDGYLARVVGNAQGTASADNEGCYFTDVVQGGFQCIVSNDAGPGTYTVNKEWILNEGENHAPDLIADVTIFCNAPILENDVIDAGNDVWYVQRTLEGVTDSVTISVDSSMGGAQCQTHESEQPAFVAVDNGCSGLLDVPSGEDTSCLITNSMFFEGIPTLGQYGKALMVLMILGMGMVGFRRFI